MALPLRLLWRGLDAHPGRDSGKSGSDKLDDRWYRGDLHGRFGVVPRNGASGVELPAGLGLAQALRAIAPIGRDQTSSFSRSGVTTRGLGRMEGMAEGLVTTFGCGAFRPSMLRIRSLTRGRKRVARKGMSSAP